MLGFNLIVHSGGVIERKANYGLTGVVDSRVLLYISARSNGPDLLGPVKKVAIEELSGSGYPSLYRVRAGDLPYELDVPDDEIVYVELWDQS
jgi:hypothetical protein